MAPSIKSGKEILDEFFANIINIPNIDKKLAEELKFLYDKNELTETKVIQRLESLRKELENDETK